MTQRRYKPTPKLVLVGLVFTLLTAITGIIVGLSLLMTIPFNTIYEAEWWEILSVGIIGGLYTLGVTTPSLYAIKNLP